jgi:sortase A
VRDVVLKWIERAFLIAGLSLGTWCAVVMLESWYTNALPLPVATTLPGEAGNLPRGTSGRIAPTRGTRLARLEVPSLGLSAAVLEGSDDGTLNRAAGHIEDTPLPGEHGNVGIAGHRDTIFRPLRNVRVGTTLDLVTPARVLRYRVSRTKIVKPEDVYVLNPTGHPTLTLVTCYPFEFIGHAPKRFIVQAELVGEERRTAAASGGR